MGDPRFDSRSESRALRIVRDAGIPEPVMHHPVIAADGVENELVALGATEQDQGTAPETLQCRRGSGRRFDQRQRSACRQRESGNRQ